MSTLYDAQERVPVKNICLHNQLGEGLYYDQNSRTVWWVDILESRIFCFDPETNKTSFWGLDTSEPEKLYPSIVIPIEDNPFCLLVTFNRLNLWYPESNEIRLGSRFQFTDDPCSVQHLRFNDGKLDLRGNLWIGTMDMCHPPRPGLGHLFCITNPCQTEQTIYRVKMMDMQGQEIKLTLSNGMGWDKSGNLFYHIDTPTRQIRIFTRIDQSDEQIVLQQVSKICLLKYQGIPDGMTVDEETGFIYVAMWEGSSVLIIDPMNDDKLISYIKLSVSCPTNIAIDYDHDLLYITTARVQGEPCSGDLYICERPKLN